MVVREPNQCQYREGWRPDQEVLLELTSLLIPSLPLQVLTHCTFAGGCSLTIMLAAAQTIRAGSQFGVR